MLRLAVLIVTAAAWAEEDFQATALVQTGITRTKRQRHVPCQHSRLHQEKRCRYWPLALNQRKQLAQRMVPKHQ